MYEVVDVLANAEGFDFDIFVRNVDTGEIRVFRDYPVIEAEELSEEEFEEAELVWSREMVTGK